MAGVQLLDLAEVDVPTVQQLQLYIVLLVVVSYSIRYFSSWYAGL